MAKKILSVVLAFVMLFSVTNCGLTANAASENTIKTSISKVESKSKGFKVTWKKKSKIKGYQVQYSTSSKFKKSSTKTKTISKATTTSVTISKLKGCNTKYYVRVRTYKTSNGKKVYSSWSASKKVTTLKHKYSKATCTKAKTCKYCKKTSGKALGHKYRAATCTKPKTCKYCKKTSGTVRKHSYSKKVVAPTCLTEGYTTHTCSDCGKKYTDSKTSALKHDYKTKVVSPTCTKAGYTAYTCKNCGHCYTDNKTQSTGHKNTKIEKLAAECSSNDYEKTVCKDCGKVIKTTTIPSTGKHNYVAKTCAEVYKEAYKYGTDFTNSYLNNYQYKTDCLTKICSGCHQVKWGEEGDIWSKYSDEEQSKIMMGYVNEIRREYNEKNPGFYNYMYHEVELVYDKKLTELANLRAKEISIKYSHVGTPTGANECIAKGQETIEDAFNCWNKSRPHYEIMIMNEGVRFGYGRYINEYGNAFHVLLVWDEHWNEASWDSKYGWQYG